MWATRETSYPRLLLLLFSQTLMAKGQDFDSLGKKVTFYPASLMVSHSAKPLVFYSETKLLNIITKLTPIEIGPLQTLTASACSLSQIKFFDKILASVRQIQNVTSRLLSLPGFSNLIECSSYLPRLYLYSTGLSSKMICPRGYRSTIFECKSWALDNCNGFDKRELHFLKPKKRTRRSAWACHAGLAGIAKGLYKLFGGKCEPNNVSGLKRALRELADAMSTSQQITRTLNGKIVYLVKFTDDLSTKMNVLTSDIANVEKTFQSWKTQLESLSNNINCQEHLLLEFLSKYSAEINRAFSSLLRLMEIQDTITQIGHLNQRTLIGYLDLPNFITSKLSIQLGGKTGMYNTIKALDAGYSILANPMVDFEHENGNLNVNILLTAPEIADSNSFCSLEYLSPIKFNFSNTCYTGPITQTNLALITCPESRQIINVGALDKCFMDDVTILCPKDTLHAVSSVRWLGFPYSHTFKLSFPRHHQQADNCKGLRPLIHLGARYFLSTSSTTLTLSTGLLKASPLAVYNFPCNVTFSGMRTGLSKCPARLEITVPTFTGDNIQYVPWEQVTDTSTLDLQYKPMKIPSPSYFNKTLMAELDNVYNLLDQQLAKELREAKKRIEEIQEVTDTSFIEILTYVALGFSLYNTICIIIIIKLLCTRSSDIVQHCEKCNKPCSTVPPIQRRPRDKPLNAKPTTTKPKRQTPQPQQQV